MVDLNGHEAGNSGHSQGKPTAYRDSSTRRETMFHHLANAKHGGLLEIWMCESPGLRRSRSLGYFTFVADNNFFVISSRLVGVGDCGVRVLSGAC
jgi:hypothetical protein